MNDLENKLKSLNNELELTRKEKSDQEQQFVDEMSELHKKHNKLIEPIKEKEINIKQQIQEIMIELTNSFKKGDLFEFDWERFIPKKGYVKGYNKTEKRIIKIFDIEFRDGKPYYTCEINLLGTKMIGRQKWLFYQNEKEEYVISKDKYSEIIKVKNLKKIDSMH